MGQSHPVNSARQDVGPSKFESMVSGRKLNQLPRQNTTTRKVDQLNLPGATDRQGKSDCQRRIDHGVRPRTVKSKRWRVWNRHPRLALNFDIPFAPGPHPVRVSLASDDGSMTGRCSLACLDCLEDGFPELRR